MLKPKKTKYRKYQKGTIKSSRKNVLFIDTLKEGVFRLDSQQSARITAKQLESCRQSISRRIKRLGKLQIRSFPDLAVSKKPTEVRMGKGKGSVDHWVAMIKPGRVLYEMEGVDEETAREAFRLAMHKLPFKTRFMKRDEVKV